jgi:ribulose-phosphate 3-epimerase
MLMAVNPGYAGQTMVPYAVNKIADCRLYLKDRGWRVPIEIDGNVSFDHIPDMVAAGADILVAGTSSLFNTDQNLERNMNRLAVAAREGLRRRQGWP